MKKILVVEDDIMMQKLYRKLLEKAGFNVDLAGTVEQAVSYLKENNYDLHLIDIMLSDGLNGSELIKTDISPVLVVSALELRQEELSTISYLRKPFQNENLIKRINSLIK